MANAEWGGKAYKAGALGMMVVRVVNSSVKAYAYPKEGDASHEKEVVFEAGVKLTCVTKQYIGQKTVYLSLSENRAVPAYVFEVDLG